MIEPMLIVLDPAHYTHVPVLYWPWVFLQLFHLHCWSRTHDREVIYDVLPTGCVVVWYVSDDETDLRAWLGRQARAERPHMVYCHNAAGDADTHIFVLWIARALERMGHRIQWVWVRIVRRPVPPFKDSS